MNLISLTSVASEATAESATEAAAIAATEAATITT